MNLTLGIWRHACLRQERRELEPHSARDPGCTAPLASPERRRSAGSVPPSAASFPAHRPCRRWCGGALCTIRVCTDGGAIHKLQGQLQSQSAVVIPLRLGTILWKEATASSRHRVPVYGGAAAPRVSPETYPLHAGVTWVVAASRGDEVLRHCWTALLQHVLHVRQVLRGRAAPVPSHACTPDTPPLPLRMLQTDGH